MDIITQIALNGVVAGSLYACVALGFNLIFAVTKFFNLAHGGMMLVGAYAALYAARDLALPLWFSFLVGIAAASLCGVLLERVLFSRLRVRRASNMVLLVASLGVMTAIQAAISMLFTYQFFSIPLTFDIPVFSIANTTMTGLQCVIIAVTSVLYFFLFMCIKKTTIGKAYTACADDSEAAEIVGIDTTRLFLLVFGVGSALAGIGGIFLGLDTGIDPTVGLAFLLKGIIASVIGGIGSVHGAFVGAYLLGLVENFGIWGLAAAWKDAIAFALLVLFLVFRPRGLFGR